MQSRQSRRVTCRECQRPVSMCYCAVLPSLTHDWPVHIIQDKREATHPLGTARPAVRALTRATLQTVDLQRARDDQQIDQWLDEFGKDAALIYPGGDALPVSRLITRQTPLTLVFIDATWRRSRRILHTWPALARLPRYQLEGVRSSRYRIRKGPGEQALSTLEAVAEVLQTLMPPSRQASTPAVGGAQQSVAGARQSAGFDAESLLRVMDFIIDQQIARMPAGSYPTNEPGSAPASGPGSDPTSEAISDFDDRDRNDGDPSDRHQKNRSQG